MKDLVFNPQKGEGEEGSLESPVPSSSSLSEARPDTPETTSAHSSPETPTTTTTTSPAPEMFNTPLKQDEYLNGKFGAKIARCL